MLIAEDIHKSYGTLEVLKGIDLTVAPGEVVALVGSSGAGKTTLLQILGTLDKPDAGRLALGDTQVHQLRGKRLAAFRNQHLGFIFQFHYLLAEFTALENAAMPALIAGMAKSEAWAAAEHWLRYLGLGERLTHRPAELSGGEQQRVAVARALVNKPSFILADEPTGNLDTANSQHMFSWFLQLAQEQQVSFVIATHNEELAAAAHRTIHMQDGRITDLPPTPSAA